MEETKEIPQGLIDSHFHLLEMEKKGFDIKSTCEKMEELGFTAGIDIGIDKDDHLARHKMLELYPFIKIASGIGPWGAEKDESPLHMIESFEKLIKERPCDAIGEIGLDFYWNYGSVEKQEELLRGQIELASTQDLPIIIHNREADNAIKEIITSYKGETSGIIHCFSSDISFAKFALDNNFYISFAGPITYKKNDSLREVVKYVPLDRLLLETDSPFLAPQFKRGRANTPLYIWATYEKAAEIRGISLSVLIDSIKENFFTLFPS
jgi:TatD DNase family protein